MLRPLCRKIAGASEGRAARDREIADRLKRAMLVACGELGYARVTVGDVLTRAQATDEDFQAHFESLQECFARAYETESQLLCERILKAGAEAATWPEGFRAALTELASYVGERPLTSKALLLEVHVAGREAIDCRTERIERLSHALDSARRENESRHSPPPLTALFMVSTIDAAVASSLTRGKPGDFLKVVPELEFLISSFYFAD